MKTLVIGGSGFIGSYVADHLTKNGHQVTIFDKKKSLWIKKNQKFVKGNILNLKQLERVIQKNEAVFHFAALADLNDALNKPIETVKINILGTLNSLEASRKFKIKRFVYASSIYASSNEGGFYKCSKKAAEDYVEEYQKMYGLNYTILRFGSLYGPRADKTNGVYKIVYDAIKNKKLKYIGSKLSIRKYIHVNDAGRATASILGSKYKNKYINLSGSKSFKITKLFEILSKELNLIKKVLYQKKKYIGHYVKQPTAFKIRKSLKFKIKNEISLKSGLKFLINEIKNNEKFN